MKEVRVKVTLRVEDRVYRAAERVAARSGAAVAAVLADAAKQALLPEYQEAREERLHKAVERNSAKLRRLEGRFAFDLHVLKEMVGLLARTYLNHTPAVPEPEREAASLSGRARFERFLDLLARNVRPGRSVLGSALPAVLPPKGEAEAGGPPAATATPASPSAPLTPPATEQATSPMPSPTPPRTTPPPTPSPTPEDDTHGSPTLFPAPDAPDRPR